MSETATTHPLYRVGDRVLKDGYPGTVTAVLDGQLSGMVEVRLARGGVCVPVDALTPLCAARGCDESPLPGDIYCTECDKEARKHWAHDRQGWGIPT